MIFDLTALSQETGTPHAVQKDIFPPFDPTHFASQIFWLALSFLLLYFVLNSFLLPRLAGILEERRDRIVDDLDAAARMQDEAKQAEASYKKALAQARARAHGIAEKKQAASQKELALEMAETEAELAKRQSAAEERIAKASLEAMKHVQAITLKTSLNLLHKIVPFLKVDTKALKESVSHASTEAS